LRVLILGSSGQLGSYLSDNIKSNKFINSKFFFRSKNKNLLTAQLKKHSPKIIINCSAYTDVNNAQYNKKECYSANSLAVKIIAQFCKKNKIFFIHFSTDYIFDGKKVGIYNERSRPNPLNYYGFTKLSGEKKIISTKCKFLILRVSWLYNLSYKNNFIAKIKRKIDKNELFELPSDQIGSPISVSLICKVIKIIISIYKTKTQNMKYGIYNLACSQPVSRYEIGLFMNKFLKKKAKIIPFISKNKNHLINRPLNSRLDTKKIKKWLKIKIPDWKQDLKKNIKLKKIL
tara:strand:- start:1700 stop:2563 length:864 start_codon:yes stop_codon:yes gene_type:complete